jgi:acylglycerol lipase
MPHSTGSFKTADGLNIHTESWLPDDPPRAVVLISHGIGEHIGRYPHVAERLLTAGYAVYGLDHRGHGKSEGVRAYYDTFDAPVEDLRLYFNWIKVQHPDKQIFLYGHSLGSLIALAFTLRYQSDLAGLIISGTTLDVESTQPAPLIAASSVLNRLTPRLGIPALPTAFLSHDPAVVQAFDADPLVFHGGVRVRMGYHIIHVSRMVKSRLGEIELPLLVVHGGDDKVCPPSGAEKLVNGAGSTDKTLKIYPNLYHEIHNEPEKSTVLEDVVNWLNLHVSTG